MEDLMLDRPAAWFLGDDLVQKPTAIMPWKTDATRDSCEPDFESGAQRIRKKYRDVERTLAPNFFCYGKQRARFQGQNFIDVWHQLPGRRDFFRRRDRDVGVGTAGLDGAHGRNANDAVPEPIRSAHENSKRLQLHFRRHVNAALVIREEKIRFRRFPAVMDPKPLENAETEFSPHEL